MNISGYIRSIVLVLIFSFVCQLPFFVVNPLYAAMDDNLAPSIDHTTNSRHLPQRKKITIGAAVTDLSGLKEVTLFYRKKGVKESYTSVKMVKGRFGRHYADIPKEFVSGSGIEYYIVAVDLYGNTSYRGLTDYPLNLLLETAGDGHEKPAGNKKRAGLDGARPFYKKAFFYLALTATVVVLLLLSNSSGVRGNENAEVLLEVDLP